MTKEEGEFYQLMYDNGELGKLVLSKLMYDHTGKTPEEQIKDTMRFCDYMLGDIYKQVEVLKEKAFVFEEIHQFCVKLYREQEESGQ